MTKKELTETEKTEIRTNYKPGENITKISRMYKTHYKQIKIILGKLYVPSQRAMNAENKRGAYQTVTGVAAGYNLHLIHAISIKKKADEIFDATKVGENAEFYIRDPEKERVRYMKVSGKVTQKTERLIFIGRTSVSKADIIEYMRHVEKQTNKNKQEATQDTHRQIAKAI